MCSVLYLAVHNKTCTGQLVSVICDVTGGRSITWGSISVSKLVYIIDFLSWAARFGGMRVKLLWMRVTDVKCVCHTLNGCELAGLRKSDGKPTFLPVYLAMFK